MKYSKEDLEKMGIDFQDLNLDELNSVAGGKKNHSKAEIEDWGRTYVWYCNEYDRLTTLRDYDTAIKLRDAYERATVRYKADMAAAPEGSPDILFSSYLAKWM